MQGFCRENCGKGKLTGHIFHRFTTQYKRQKAKSWEEEPTFSFYPFCCTKVWCFERQIAENFPKSNKYWLNLSELFLAFLWYNTVALHCDTTEEPTSRPEIGAVKSKNQQEKSVIISTAKKSLQFIKITTMVDVADDVTEIYRGFLKTTLLAEQLQSSFGEDGYGNIILPLLLFKNVPTSH